MSNTIDPQALGVISVWILVFGGLLGAIATAEDIHLSENKKKHVLSLKIHAF